MFSSNTSAPKTADGSQPSCSGGNSGHSFGGGPHFETEFSLQNQSKNLHNQKDRQPFVSDHPTFEDLNPPSYSFSDQRYRGNDERTVEDEEQNSKGDLVIEESNDEELSHGQCKSETKESRSDELAFGYKFGNIVLTDNLINNTNSPKSTRTPLRSPMLTTASGSDQHSKDRAFSGDPKVASSGFKIPIPQPPHANHVQDVGKILDDGIQSSNRGNKSAASFGGDPQFCTGSPLQKQSKHPHDNRAFARYKNSERSTFEDLNQTPNSFSDQKYREPPKE